MTDDDTPPLLQSWLMFRKSVLHQKGAPAIDEAMVAFYGGAGGVLMLLKSAWEQGGQEEADFAFSILMGELEGFKQSLQDRTGKQKQETMQ